MMLAKNARFWPDRKRPGVELKHLGTFSEGRTGMSFLRVAPGAEIKAGTQEDTELRFCVDGTFSYGGQSWGAGTYLHLPFGADVKALASEKGATFFVITLPMLADIAAARGAGAHPSELVHAA
jgi:hypothetical protein